MSRSSLRSQPFKLALLACLAGSGLPRSLPGAADDWEAAARAALARGELETATRHAEAAQHNPATAAAAREVLGSIAFQEKRNEEAISHYQAARSLGRLTPEMIRSWSAALLALSRYSEARELIQIALSRDPAQVDLRYRLAGSYVFEGKWKEAWPHLEEVYRGGLRHSGVVLQLARARFAAGHDLEAIDLLGSLMTSTISLDSLRESGKLLFEKALYRQAIEPLSKAWGRERGSHEIGMYLALSHYLLGQFPESERVLLGLPPSSSSSLDYQILLGSVHARLGKWKQAGLELETAVKAAPDRADGYLNLALFYLEQSDPARAMELFRMASPLTTRGTKLVYAIPSRKSCEGVLPPEAQSTRNETADLLSLFGEQLRLRHQNGSAFEVFLLSLKTGSSSAIAYAGLGRLCWEADSVREARIFLEKGLALHPNSANLHFNLGLVQQSLGNLVDAVRLYQKAIALRRPQATALDWIQLGTAQQAAGAVQEAEGSYQKGLDLDPRSAQGHYELGKLYFQQKDLDRAEQALAKATELDPSLVKAFYQYGQVCLRRGDPERGKMLLDKFHRKKTLYEPEDSPEKTPTIP